MAQRQDLASARRVLDTDVLIQQALDLSYHDGAGGWDSTGVRWWIKFNLANGEDPMRVAGPEAPLEAKLADEWRLMRFIVWLCEQKHRTVAPDTANAYASTVQGWLARNFGVKIGAGMDLHRRAQLIKGLHRMRGGKALRKLRKALTPEKLARALKLLDRRDPLHANVRAALTAMTQGLLRAGEAVLSDKAKAWSPAQHLSRADVAIGRSAMEMTIASEKDAETLGAKCTPIVIGRAGDGAYIDAVSEFENLRRVDPVSAASEARTPAFRDPRTGKPLRVRDVHRWVRELMAMIGENPEDYGSHSCRIGGATAMFAAGCSALDIRTAGRWSSDVYLIYVHADRSRAAAVSRAIASTVCRPTEDPFDEVADY